MHKIGDASSPRSIGEAILEAARLVESIGVAATDGARAPRGVDRCRPDSAASRAAWPAMSSAVFGDLT